MKPFYQILRKNMVTLHIQENILMEIKRVGGKPKSITITAYYQNEGVSVYYRKN